MMKVHASHKELQAVEFVHHATIALVPKLSKLTYSQMIVPQEQAWLRQTHPGPLSLSDPYP